MSAADIRRVTNQPPPLAGHNVVTGDAALSAAVLRHADEEALDSIASLGAEAGTAEAQEHGRLANRFHPELVPYDRYGNRVDEVAFHPSWHWLMGKAVGHGLAAAPWALAEKGDNHAHVRRAAGFFAWGQTEPGHMCPISMTYAAVPALRADKSLAEEWVPRLASTTYDFGLRDPAEKLGALAGMGMTEKQGGSDVRQNITEAHPVGGDVYELHGHKWFTSAPMNDVFLVLAQAPGGLTCFLLPASFPRVSATAWTWCGSRTSSATAPTPAPSWSSAARRPTAWARKDAAYAPSSRWSPPPASTACSAPPR